jgi:hypothetical protein
MMMSKAECGSDAEPLARMGWNLSSLGVPRHPTLLRDLGSSANSAAKPIWLSRLRKGVWFAFAAPHRLSFWATGGSTRPVRSGATRP